MTVQMVIILWPIIPAKKLYEKNGFVYLGDVDLGRGIEYIPEFSLYELNLC